MARYVRRLNPTRRRQQVGGKRAGLASLIGLGLRVPTSYVCSSRAHKRYVRSNNPSHVLTHLERELRALGMSSAQECAVRSSATAEDRQDGSMAGQYTSLLWVQGVDAIVEGIRAVWDAHAKLETRFEGTAGDMEVLIQAMVPAVVSGASFSRHPVTGADEVIVEGVEGTSESFLQRGETPRHWVVRQEQVEGDSELLPREILDEIARTTRRVAQAMRYPADLEWAFDGKGVWWLQVRPITSLRGLPVYSNRISREYLPGLVKPLVWSINVPMINGAWVDLFEQVVGPLAIDPLSLAKQFHYRAYFNMSGMGALFRRLGLPEDALEQVFGLVATANRSPFRPRWKMVQHLPRLSLFLLQLASFHRRLTRWEQAADAFLMEREQSLEKAKDLPELMEWAQAFRRWMRGTARHRILSLLLHLTIGQLGRRAAQRQGVTDPTILELPDPRLMDLQPEDALRVLSAKLERLEPGVRRSVEELPFDEFIQLEALQDAREQLDEIIERFGYIGESGNDFSSIPWKENPEGVLRLAFAQVDARAKSRPSSGSAAEDRAVARWARRVTRRCVDRERVGAVFSRGFHLLHVWALRVGAILADRGVISTAYDVFYFTAEDLAGIAAGDLTPSHARQSVRTRQREIVAATSIRLPDIILGDRVVGAKRVTATSGDLVGLGVSRGIHEGSVCVVRGSDEFTRFRNGDVLVVPYSDVAWTPLFVRAGSIVAEAGGILSHSAIVARELGIPAVVSVPGACELLDGARVRVDGLEGRVTLLDVS